MEPEDCTGPEADKTATTVEMSALAEQVAHMAHVILSEVPERLRMLIPSDLSPAQQVAWYLQAKKTGVFGAAPAVPVPETDAGRPAITPRDADLSTLPPMARIAAGYRK